MEDELFSSIDESIGKFPVSLGDGVPNGLAEESNVVLISTGVGCNTRYDVVGCTLSGDGLVEGTFVALTNEPFLVGRKVPTDGDGDGAIVSGEISTVGFFVGLTSGELFKLLLGFMVSFLIVGACVGNPVTAISEGADVAALESTSFAHSL